jgi:hypothetical protein
MIWHQVNQDEAIDDCTFLSNRELRAEYQRAKSYNHRTNKVSIDRFSYHAQKRAAQRGLSPDDVVYILHYGRCYHAADAIFYLLLGKDIPDGDHHKMSRLIGTAIVVDKEHSTIITIWRNRQNAVRNIRRKLAAIWCNRGHEPDPSMFWQVASHE